MEISEEIVQAPEGTFEGNLGTGEGIAEAYMGGKKEERGQVRWNAYFTLDEGLDLYRLDERKGATVLQTARSAWTGKRLGNSNATGESFRKVVNYCWGMVIGWQPHTLHKLLADAIVGTPQRGLYVR